MRIGLTTGFAFKEIYPVSEGAFSVCREVSSDLVEINCIGGIEEIDALDFVDYYGLSNFGTITFHAPCIGVRYGQNLQTKEIFSKIEEICRRIKIDVVVFHPDIVDDFLIFNSCSFPVAFENMDARKSFAKTVDDLEKVFQLVPEAGFVLDANHCFSIDRTMILANEMLARFGERLCEVHVSGFLFDYHGLIHLSRQDIILEAIPDVDVPIVIESLCHNTKDIKREYEYIRSFFEKKFGHK